MTVYRVMNTLERLVNLSILALDTKCVSPSQEEIEHTVAEVCAACEALQYELYVTKLVTVRLMNRKDLEDGT